MRNANRLHWRKRKKTTKTKKKKRTTMKKMSCLNCSKRTETLQISMAMDMFFSTMSLWLDPASGPE